MMAGTGVSVGSGVGMLRTRRRDVSVKPNRKLDRKSSRGMIYENEELRLRTIHINAEVEQGQNDIKKLRRENEQLRREIWSLRDEYDKLEEILKRQKNRGESEEYEDRSEEDEGLRSEYSCEEDEEVGEEEDERSTADGDQEERLENAENQKISTEKMNTGNPHRLHVDFDDLSVVDEEEELKKDREKKDEERQQRQKNDSRARRQLQDNFPFYPSTYDSSSGGFSAASFYPECPFQFPTAIDTPTMSPCTPLFGDGRLPITSVETGENCVNPALPVMQIPSVGWQNSVLFREEGLSGNSRTESSQVDSRLPLENPLQLPTFGTSAGSSGKAPNLLQRRNVSLRQPIKFSGNDTLKDSRTQSRNSEEKTARTVWQLSAVPSEERNDRPKHFFAPLPSKLRSQKAEEDFPDVPVSQFGTTNSSSSDKTDSTVVLRLSQGKGSMDVCVNGAIPWQRDPRVDRDDQRTFLSTGNLLVGDARSDLGDGQLTKSISCQNLASDSQNGVSRFEQLRVDGKPQGKLAKSDNTLDGISNEDFTRPYKTHLNVTLKMPGHSRQTPSPEIPEIPELPSMDCRVLRNPFLRNYADSPVTQPLSIQVNEANPAHQYANPSVLGSFPRGTHKPIVQGQENRLLIPTDQLINEKILSPLAKQEIQVTSFERPSPHTLIPPATPYDLETLRRITTNRFLASQNLYQNVPFVPGRPYVCPTGVNSRLYLENAMMKVPAQTQTSIDGDSHQEDEQAGQQAEGNASGTESPGGQRKKKATKKEKVSTLTSKEQSSFSPATERRLRKQNSSTSAEGSIPESPGKVARPKSRKSSIADIGEDKNESRSSSSGQDSPRKDQARRASVYFNGKQRPSLASVKTTRSGSIDVSRDKYVRDVLDGNPDRERTNSVSSRDTSKQRKTSTSSGNVPWCACWGNGCV